MMNTWKSGEKEFLLALHKKLGDTGLGWRDDCIERQITPNMSLVYSIDSTGRKLRHNKVNDAKTFGKWAASIISNDVIACGVCPRGLALDIGLGAFKDENEIFEFVDGVLSVCTQYKMNYEGGNINRSSLVSGVAWGIAPPGAVIHRGGAKNGSVLLATAPIGLGWTAELLQTAESLKRAKIPAELNRIIDSYKENPVINLAAFQEIWELGLIECGMDLTDGIIEFGYEIFERTGLGVVFSPQPPHRAVEFVASLLSVTPEDIMFEPGFDAPFAHGWCIQESDLHTILRVLEKHKVAYTILGRVSDKVSGVYRKCGDTLRELPRYWDDKMKNESTYDLWLKYILQQHHGHTVN